MRTMFAAGLVVALACGVAPLVARTTGVLPETCSKADEDLWHYKDETLGIFVTDKARRIGGAIGILKFDPNGLIAALNPLVAGYYPVSGQKEIACGRLDHWLVYRLDPLERDLHPFIKPSPLFGYVLSDLPAYANKDCPNGCIWGEVTVPSVFEWFWKEHSSGSLKKGDNLCAEQGVPCAGKTSEFAGGQFCMYGPWIMERAHDFHPEIHPVQVFWGQTHKGYASIYAVDDDSTRFNRAEAFGSKYLSTDFKPWSGSFDGMLYQVVRSDVNHPASLTWDDAGGPLRSTTIDSGAGAIEIKSPAWIAPALASSCVASDHRTQVVIQAPLVLTPSVRWRGLNISGANTGVTYTTPSQGSSGNSTPQPEQESAWESHTIVQWAERSGVARTKFGPSAAAWGLSDQREWSAVARQRILVTAANVKPDAQGDPVVPAGLRAKWTIVATDLDHPSRPVEDSAVMLDLDFDRNVPTDIDSNVVVRRHDTTHPGEFALLARFATGDAGAAGVFVGNYRVKVTSRIWSGSHVDEQTTDLFSIVPDQLAAVSGYNLKKMHGVFPERLAKLILPLARGNSCQLTLPQFTADLNGGPPTDTVLVDTLLSRRRRTAGILRQSVNFFLADGTLTPGEFGELLNILRRYQGACAAMP